MRSQALLLAGCLAACGGDDAAVNGTVTVTAHGGFDEPIGPKAGVDVIAIDPDGTGRVTTTDDDGVAELTVVAGGAIAALYPGQLDGVEVHAVLGVEPGDQLIFGDDLSFDRGEEVGTMTVTLPAIAGTSTYWVRGACGMSGESPFMTPSVPIRGYEHCDPTQDLIVTATDADAELLGYAILPSVAFEADGAVVLDTWQAPGALALSITGMSAEVLNLDFFAAVEHGTLASSDNLAPSGGSASATVTWAPVGSQAYASATLRSFEGQQDVRDAIDVTATSHAFDPPGLPWITDVTADLATAGVAVTTDGAYEFDATQLQLGFSRDFQSTLWYVLAPPTTGEAITLPTLPAPFDDHNLAAGVQLGTLDAALVDYVDDDSYAATRERSFATGFHASVRSVSGSGAP